MVPLARLDQLTDLASQNAVDVVRLDVEEERARRPLSDRVLAEVNVVIDICMVVVIFVFEKAVTRDAMLLGMLLQAGLADIHTEAASVD